MSAVQLFISHSERDEPLVRPLAGWLQKGLGLKENDVRCTVVTNMAVGSFPAEVLRDDLLNAKAVIGLITANSLRSHWAQLEMGAGWLQKRLHPIRGPGIHALDLPSPLSDFTTVGYCEKDSMQNLLHQLATVLGSSVQAESGREFDAIAETAQEILLADRVRWFSLPPVLSAWRIDRVHYDCELRTLCTALGLRTNELNSCVNEAGLLNRDPEQIPIWAMGLWTVSKNAVNYMLSPRSAGSGVFDVPDAVLPDKLVADMTRALSSKKNRARLIRKWFQDCRDWITANAPLERSGHGIGHR